MQILCIYKGSESGQAGLTFAFFYVLFNIAVVTFGQTLWDVDV